MKFCKDCKYSSNINNMYYCKNEKLGLDCVTGEVTFNRCSVVRLFDYYTINEKYYCGPDGKWFEPKIKTKKKNLWQKIKNVFS